MDTQTTNRTKIFDGTITAESQGRDCLYGHDSDVKNVPTPIAKHARLLHADKPAYQTLREYLADIELTKKRANQVGAQIRGVDFQEDTKHEATQILPLIQEAVRFLRATIPATIAIATTFEPTLPDVLLDGAYVHQVLINLCTNAVHAMQRSGGRLKIAVTSKTLDIEAVKDIPELNAGCYVLLTVSDTGHGMSQDTQQYIFDPFFTTKKNAEGTGLGLFIVHYIIMKHGGSISVSSELGRGTTFTIYLPAIETGSLQASSENPQVANDNRKHILFIDDDHLLVQLATRKLQFLDYVVSGFQHPEAALRVFRNNPYQFDAVIMDHYMPAMNGQELAREMLSLRPNLPIIMLSGYIRSDDAERICQLGVRTILSKSDAVSRIDQVLYNMIGSSQTVRSNKLRH